MRLKFSENYEAQFSKLNNFIGQKLIFRHYCIQIVKVGIKIRICNINNEFVTHFSQFNLEKVEKNLRKSQAQFREKLRKLRLRQKYVFLYRSMQKINFSPLLIYMLSEGLIYRNVFSSFIAVYVLIESFKKCNHTRSNDKS